MWSEACRFLDAAQYLVATQSRGLRQLSEADGPRGGIRDDVERVANRRGRGGDRLTCGGPRPQGRDQELEQPISYDREPVAGTGSDGQLSMEPGEGGCQTPLTQNGRGELELARVRKVGFAAHAVHQQGRIEVQHAPRPWLVPDRRAVMDFTGVHGDDILRPSLDGAHAAR